MANTMQAASTMPRQHAPSAPCSQARPQQTCCTHVFLPARPGSSRSLTSLCGQVAGLQKQLGGSLDPHACFLLQRGIQTLPLRVAHQAATALALATFLQDQPQVLPGLWGSVLRL